MLAGVLAATLAPAPSAAEEAAPRTPPQPAASQPAASHPVVEPGVYTVPLITGDQVLVEQHADGRVSVDIDPADRGGVPADFETVRTGEDVYVLPGDATSLVPSLLDMELFNVTGLVRSGYHADDTGHLSVIVTYERGQAPKAATFRTDRTTPLPSVGGEAMALDRAGAERLWERTVAPRGTAPASRSASAGVEKIWLDTVHEVALDESVPIVEAPAAWDAGYDGEGATVAVLDTGIDADHPDLAGQVVDARNFTAEDDAADNNGHGTHVAATVAGTGAGSEPARAGVAPGADVVNAKVCNGSGNCPSSSIIGGMEWVAEDLGLSVANLSIGTSTASDGTDPLSQAVNQLTEEHGTLFVIAAGNSGSRPVTVGSPGAADAALTVGSVFKSGFLSSSSSRGPRRGDFAVKPDITAPGVSIVAARAAGTSMGSPVDDLYTSASGTSMATPHVAGAAAILLQQDPDLSPAQAKAILASTGTPHSSFDVYQQGGGQLDVAAAVATPVVATPAPLNLGYFPYPHDDAQPATHTVTYTNRTDAELTLALSTDVADEDEQAPAEGMLTLGSDTVTVPADGEATVDVTVDVAAGDYGIYGGYLVAESDGDMVSRTPLGFVKEDERYGLTIRGIDTEGDPASGAVTVLNVEDEDEFFELSVPYDGAGEAHVRVPPGTYAVYGFADTHPADEVFATVRTAVAAPEFEVVAEDVELVFDARDAVPMSVEAPEHEVAPRNRTAISMFREPVRGAGAVRGVQAFADGTQFQVLPSDEATTGYFELFSRWQLADPDDPVGTSVLYDVTLPEIGAIPADATYEVRPGDLATVHQEFYHHELDRPVAEVRHAWRPWQSSSIGIFEELAAPNRRTEYLSAADTASWTRALDFVPSLPSTVGRINAPRMEYPVGASQTNTWMKQPVTPGFLEGSPWHRTFPQFREGNELELFIPEFSDSQHGHWGFRTASIDDTAFRLFQDGELVADGARASGTFTLDPEPSRARVELDVGRDADWWRYSTHTSTAWEFDTAYAEPFVAEVVTPELMALDLEYLTGSPEIEEPLQAPVVSAGIGEPEDFDGVDADGAVVFMQRGVLTFAEKAQHAADAGAVAAVVYNNAPGGFGGNVGDDAGIPAYSLSMEQGLDVVDLVDAGDVAIELTPGETDVVPMLLVDYDVELDLLNNAPHPRDLRGPHVVDIQVRHQPGFDSQPVADRPAIEDARLWVSYDDGDSWRERPSRDLGDGQFRFPLDMRAPGGANEFVSLRVEAWDVAGNRIEQEVTRAWGLTPR